MNVDTKTTMEITLKLTAKEAIWLKGLMQNAQSDPSDESDEDIAMRTTLFDVLPSFLDLFQADTEVSSTENGSARPTRINHPINPETQLQGGTLLNSPSCSPS